MGTRYLGGCIGDNVSKGDCPKIPTEKWERYICALRKMVDKYHQGVYATLARAVQLGWILLQRVTKDTGQAFTGQEIFLLENFLPRFSLENRKPSLQL